MTVHNSQPRAEGRPFGATWVVTAAWAHPVWHSYIITLYDLTTVLPAPHPPAKLHAEGVTHEVGVWALDPSKPVPTVLNVDGTSDHPVKPLTPANHLYQFTAESDEAAEARIAELVKDIERGRLSPDTDFTSAWDQVFADGVTLKNRQAWSLPI